MIIQRFLTLPLVINKKFRKPVCRVWYVSLLEFCRLKKIKMNYSQMESQVRRFNSYRRTTETGIINVVLSQHTRY